MLEQLKLSNLALSNQAEVDFTPGMICITGETGAGKSLVVDALSLVLGAKADVNLIRQGQKQMEISALFSIAPNSQVHRLLEEFGFAEERSCSRKSNSALKMLPAAASDSQVAALSSSIVDSDLAASNVAATAAISLPSTESAVLSEVKVVNGTSVLSTGNTVISQPQSGAVSASALAQSDAATLRRGVALSSALSAFLSTQTSPHLVTPNPLSQSAIEADGQAVGLPESSLKDAHVEAANVPAHSNSLNAVLEANASVEVDLSAAALKAQTYSRDTISQPYDLSTTSYNVSSTQDYSDLILRRVISAEGKSKAYINGHMATLGQLREISECLVAIHGQHASVQLMDEKHQLEIVDNFGKLRDLVVKVNQAYDTYAKLRSELTRLADAQKVGAIEYKQDRHELEELKHLDLHEGDYEDLEARFDKAMHQAQFMTSVTEFYNLIEGGDSNLVSMLRDRQSALDKVKSYDPAISTLIENIETAIGNLHDCSSQAEALMVQDIEFSTTELEARMSKAHELSRRFACLPKELYLMTERLEHKVNTFLGLKDQIEALKIKVQDSRQAYEKLSDELTALRQMAAQDLASKISTRLKELALPDARFDIVLTRSNEGRPRPNGRDNLCFMFSANLGQDLKPLSAVASGGELSRLALIIEVLTASVKSTPTLIFDEVDTGISGRTASAVGSLLHELGEYVQVITVTHLPQVAAKAHTQFVVAKYNEAGQVNSTISLLDNQGRIEEISRMIGGSVITDTTRKSALELLNGV